MQIAFIPGRRKVWFMLRVAAQLVDVFVFAWFASIAVIAVSEIVARQEVSFAIRERIIEVTQDKFINVPTPIEPAGSPEPTSEQSEGVSDLKVLKRLQRTLGLLLAHGSTVDDFTAERIRIMLVQPQALLAPPPARPWYGFHGRIQYLDNEKILAILVMSCSTIGALIAGMRKKDFTTFRDLTLGLATGFLTFLVVKGGKHLFIMQIDGGNLYFNPYSLALSGVLAGLFSDRFYELISSLLDEFFKRLKHSLGGKDASGEVSASNLPPASMATDSSSQGTQR